MIGITRGADNALWFTRRGGFAGPAGIPLPLTGFIGRMTTAGDYTLAEVEGEPAFLTTGPDDALWFTNQYGSYTIGRYTLSGELTMFTAPDAGTGGEPPLPLRIVRGPEDNLWFTTEQGIWRINLAGTMEEIVPLRGTDYAFDIAPGPDGRLYFTAPEANRVGHVDALAFAPITLANGGPSRLVRGADDSIWFVDDLRSTIGRIRPDGSVTQTELGEDNGPSALALAPDGTAWFTESFNDTVGHIMADGEVVYFAIRSLPSNPQDIVLGPDGNFWFTERDAGSISRITPQGVITRFPVPVAAGAVGPRVASPFSQPSDIAVGPDDNLWFTDPGLNAIGRITTGGEIVTFPVRTPDALPLGITAGADGHLYVTLANAGRIARVTTAGLVIELGTPDPQSFPAFITLGPDGAIWFTEFDAGRLGRMGRDGRITKFELPLDDAAPAGIVGRRDGRLFVALPHGEQILYTDLAAAEPTRTATPTATATRTVPPGSTATATRTVTRTVPPGSTATPTRDPAACSGDCNGDQSVTIADLVLAVNVALGSAPVDACPSGDTNDDGLIVINELIVAVTNALQGCAS